MRYPIMFGQNRVGFAGVEQQGMCMIIRCRCTEAASLKNTIYVGALPLGKCVPEGGAFTLTRRIPKRDMPAEPRFVMGEQAEATQIVLREGEPVLGLENLRNARFFREGEKAVLEFTDQISNSNKTGQ